MKLTRKILLMCIMFIFIIFAPLPVVSILIPVMHDKTKIFTILFSTILGLLMGIIFCLSRKFKKIIFFLPYVYIFVSLVSHYFPTIKEWKIFNDPIYFGAFIAYLIGFALVKESYMKLWKF